MIKTSSFGQIQTDVGQIEEKTNNLPIDPADASDIASAFTGVNSKLDTISSKTTNIPASPSTAAAVASVQSDTTAIKAKTDNLPAAPAAQAKLDTVEAAVSSGTYGLSALKTLIDILTGYVDTEVAAIKANTDNLPDRISVSTLTGSGQLNTGTSSTYSSWAVVHSGITKKMPSGQGGVLIAIKPRKTGTNETFFVQIGIGTSGNEIPIATFSSAGVECTSPGGGVWPIAELKIYQDLPANTRVTIRAYTDSNTFAVVNWNYNIGQIA